VAVVKVARGGGIFDIWIYAPPVCIPLDPSADHWWGLIAAVVE